MGALSVVVQHGVSAEAVLLVTSLKVRSALSDTAEWLVRKCGPPPAACRREYTTTPHLQEALYICRGSEGAAAVMRLAAGAQDELWRAVAAGRDPGETSGWAALRAAPGVVSCSLNCNNAAVPTATWLPACCSP